MDKTKKLEKYLTLHIGEQSYRVSFPNVRQLLAIENMKASLSNDSYGTRILTNTMSASFSLDLIDTIAHVSVLIPDLKENLGIKNFGDLDPIEAKKLIKIYKKQIHPWLAIWFEELYKDEDEDEETEEKDEEVEQV